MTTKKKKRSKRIKLKKSVRNESKSNLIIKDDGSGFVKIKNFEPNVLEWFRMLLNCSPKTWMCDVGIYNFNHTDKTYQIDRFDSSIETEFDKDWMYLKNSKYLSVLNYSEKTNKNNNK